MTGKTGYSGTKRMINEKELYHNMIIRLFRNLPDSQDCSIVFSERGKTFSDNSLVEALGKARNLGVSGQTAQTIIKKMPSNETGVLYGEKNEISLEKIKMRK
ncbi:hypothetical protein LQZ19_04520 [Treponema primitia]|uniref:hypothetical protein n=1 Tax=Treponema primitia TaxID=88058 RepID=UPI00397FEF73